MYFATGQPSARSYYLSSFLAMAALMFIATTARPGFADDPTPVVPSQAPAAQPPMTGQAPQPPVPPKHKAPKKPVAAVKPEPPNTTTPATTAATGSPSSATYDVKLVLTPSAAAGGAGGGGNTHDDPKFDPKGTCGSPTSVSIDGPTLLISYSPQIVVTQSRRCTTRLDTASALSPRACFANVNDVPTRDEFEDGTIRTNHSLKILIIHAQNLSSSVSGTAAISIQPPTIASSGRDTLTGSQNLSAPFTFERNDDQCHVDEWSLQPRAAGGYQVKSVLLSNSGSELNATAYTVEVAVEKEYIGAIRFGVVGALPVGTSRGVGTSNYGVRASANGGTAIYEAGYSPVDIELVTGYTAFFSKRGDRDLDDFGFGWFAGLGLVGFSAASSTVTAIPSTYTGLDISGHGLALLLLVGLHRETELSEGYGVGSPYPAGSAPTTTKVYPSFAIGVSFSSDVLKVSSNSASSGSSAKAN